MGVSSKWKICDGLLAASIVALIFDYIPWPLQLSFISNGMSSKLSWYFLFAFSILVLKYHLNLLRSQEAFPEKYFLGFIVSFIVSSVVSNIWGWFDFPYFQDILLAPAGQIKKLPIVLHYLAVVGLNPDYGHIISIWTFIRSIKSAILYAIYTFGFAYVVYCYIKRDFSKYYVLMEKAVMASVAILSIYSIVEVFYLAGNNTATYILTQVNPLLHTFQYDHDWWPPLLWRNQLRSVFAEPSRVGNYIAFAIPILWGKLFTSGKLSIHKDCFVVLEILLLTFFTFLTKARTAVALYGGLIFLLIVWVALIRKRALLKNAFIVFCITAVAFAGSLQFISAYMLKPGVQSRQIITAKSYLDDNVGSLANSTRRSNGARYALIRANFQTGKEHPLFGVGGILTSSYTVHNFNEQDLANHEVAMWVHDYYEQGPLSYGLGAMNEYVSRFAQYGSVGLILFLIAPVLIFKKLILKIKKASGILETRLVIVLITLIATLVAGCNGSLTLLYTYWIVLGYAYAAIYGKTEDKSSDYKSYKTEGNNEPT